MKPVLLAFLAATMWGLWWMPIRYLEGLGLTGAMGGMAMNAGAFGFSVIWVAWSRKPPRLQARAVLGAVLVGVAVTTCSAALNQADVVRAILLFYLAPAWAKIIEWAFMGMRWRWTATLSLGAALLGAFLVLGGKIDGGALAAGDVLAVLSGVSWAAGAALIFTSARADVMSLTLVTSLSATLVGLPFLITGGAALAGSGAAMATMQGAGIGMLYVLPVMVLTLWSAQRLTPAVLSFLLTAEILSGVGSGVWLLDEPFGPFQAAGATLILLAAVSEVLPGLARTRSE